jgi:O-antigen/teichoic acid export membrane protein
MRLHAGWGIVASAFTLQPIALFLLPPNTPSNDGVRPTAGAGWRSAAPYFVSQAAWLVFSESPLLLLRAIDGPGAAGRLATMTRLLDLLALVGPVMANFALPAFVLHATRGDAGRAETGRLNALIAFVGALSVTAGAQFGWLFWKLAFPLEPFPIVEFAVLAFAAGVNASGGLPDRILQATGRARTVSIVGTTVALFLVVSATVAIARFGLLGGVVARLFAYALANATLLALSSLPRAALATNASLAVAAAGAASLLLVRFGEGSILLTMLASLAASIVTLTLAAPWLVLLQRAHSTSNAGDSPAHP